MARHKGFSVYQNKNGTFTAQTTIGYNDDGKPIRKSETADTELEAITRILPYVKDKEQSAKVAQLLPIKKHMLYWLMQYVQYTVTSRTFESKIQRFKTHIVPAIGDYLATDVTTNMIQQMLTNLLDKDYHIETVNKIKGIMNGYFEYCIDEQIINSNPVSRVKLNNKRQKKQNITKLEDKAIPEEYKEKFLLALNDNPFMKALCLTAILSGTRPGELLALKWKDFDEEAGTLSIERGITVDVEFDDDGNVIGKKTVLGATKTAGSVRENPVSQSLINILDDWKEYRKIQEKLTGISLTTENDFIFATNQGDMRTYNGIRQMFDKFLLQHNLAKCGIHLYALRHTYANDLFENGENPRVVQLLLGHAKLTTTMIYNTGTKMKNLVEAVNKQDDKYISFANKDITDEKTLDINKLLDIIKRYNLRDELTELLLNDDDFQPPCL